MAYPGSITSFTEKVNLGQIITSESHTIPLVDPFTVVLNHLPRYDVPSSISIPGFTEVSGSPGSNQFQVVYASGLIYFNSSNAGQSIGVSYKCVGDEVIASHVNDLQNEAVIIETTLGANPQGSYTDVAERLDKILKEYSDENFSLLQKVIGTNSATPTLIHSVDIEEDSTILIEVKTVIRRTGGGSGSAADSGGMVKRGVWKRNGSSIPELVGNVQQDFAVQDQEDWDVDFEIISSGININALGTVDNIISWHNLITVQKL